LITDNGGDGDSDSRLERARGLVGSAGSTISSKQRQTEKDLTNEGRVESMSRGLETIVYRDSICESEKTENAHPAKEGTCE